MAAAVASTRRSSGRRPTSDCSPLLRASAGASYSTFGASAPAEEAPPPLGLSMRAARARLLAAIERKIEQKERSSNLTTEFRDPFALLLVLCSGFRFADLARRLEAGQTPRAVEALLEGAFLVAAAAGNALMNHSQKRRHHAEMAERVRVAVRQMLAHNAGGGASPTATTEREERAQRPSAMLLPSNSYVACYRDSQWLRLPMNLLVEGDIVGLMSGDIAPGDVRLVVEQDKAADAMAGAVESAAAPEYPRGSKLPSWTSPPPPATRGDSVRCTATFNAPLLLELCGEMRVFEMRETPVVRDIEHALFSIRRPDTFTQKLLVVAQRAAGYICALYSVCVLLAIAMRAALQHRTMDTTLNHLLLGPVGIWLCFASLHTPFVLFLAEAAATASILSAFQDIVVPQSATSHERQHRHHHHHHHHHQYQSKRRGRDQVDELSPTRGVRDRSGSSSEAQDQGGGGDAAPTPASPKALNTSDAFDVEDREKLRSEKARATQSALGTWLRYLLVALKFRVMRCDQAHVSSRDGRRRLPIPFRSFRLLERLGSTTMLCCFDDDILCDQSPSAEEIFLLTDRQGSTSTVLDLHLDRDCETGLKFEDPRWKQHLPSLKPIGLAIMLNDTENPARLFHENVKYLSNEDACALDDLALPTAAAATTALGSRDRDGDRDYHRCLQRLSVHVRMLPFPKYLLNLSREMGFDGRVDLAAFQRRQSIHVICPRLAHHEHASDHHDQGQEDSRYRGNLKSHMYSTVVLDQRSHRHQLVSRGHPTVVLAHCTEYWDGKSICPLTSDKQRAILEMYNQWRVEDLDCVALSYVPVPHRINALFSGGRTSAADAGSSSKLPPVFLVSDSAIGDEEEAAAVAAALPASRSQRGHFEGSSVFSEDRQSAAGRRGSAGRAPQPSPTAATPPVSPRSNEASVASEASPRHEGGAANEDGASAASPARPPTPSSAAHLYSRRRSGMGRAPSDVASSAGMALAPAPSEEGGSGADKKAALLWQVQDDQIFLGMVATGIQPKKSIPDLIEDLDACGVRFVYFSPRNMRRSKLLAEKMGIETDWNCAISLRPLASDGPDPHRMTSTYSDWDVKARLPHGVAAIKRHLAEVDNVPLLVSLYTDSTPETIRDMIGVFQAHHEVVMGVGSSLKEANAPLFAAADVAIGIQGKPHAFFHERVPAGARVDWRALCEEDLQFSHVLSTLACAFRLKSVEDDGDNKGATPSLPHLLELLRLGRRLLANLQQLHAFIFVSQLQIATLIAGAYLLPFPVVAQLSCASIFWLLWGLVPVLSLTMLASASDPGAMKRTPRKNEPVDAQSDAPRLVAYVALRHVPSALLAILAFEGLLGLSLRASVAAGAGLDGMDAAAYRDFGWLDFVLRSSDLVRLRPRPPALTTAVDRAEAGMLLALALSIVASSAGYLYRCESLRAAPPTRCNRTWMAAAALLLAAQTAVSVLRAGLEGADGTSLWRFAADHVPWYAWALGYGAWPLLVVAVDEAAKAHDRAHLSRYYKFLRMQFDTRLGMWSPK